MLAVDTAQPAHHKLSLFHRLARKRSNEECARNIEAYNAAMHAPRRLSKPFILDVSVPSSPILSEEYEFLHTPPRSKSGSPYDENPPSPPMSKDKPRRKDSGNDYPVPHLTKDKGSRKDRTYTHVPRSEILKVVRERLSEESSTSSTTSTRVSATAIPKSPFTSTPKIAPWNVYLPPAQVHQLYMGFLPTDMEDKWFIYSEGPDTMGKLKVHFHRSWTGQKIAELFVVMDVKGEGAGKIVGLKWDASRDAVGYGKMSADDAKNLTRTTLRWVLHVELEES